jgi:hypothetical protein
MSGTFPRKRDGSELGPAQAYDLPLLPKALALEQSGLSYQRVPPGYRFPYGHTHKKSAHRISARLRAKTFTASAAGGLTGAKQVQRGGVRRDHAAWLRQPIE